MSIHYHKLAYIIYLFKCFCLPDCHCLYTKSLGHRCNITMCDQFCDFRTGGRPGDYDYKLGYRAEEVLFCGLFNINV